MVMGFKAVALVVIGIAGYYFYPTATDYFRGLVPDSISRRVKSPEMLEKEEKKRRKREKEDNE